MSSNSVRSSSLPPYAAPAIHGLEAQRTAPAASFVPYVPPTWLAYLDGAETGTIAESAAGPAPSESTGWRHEPSTSVTAAAFAPESPVENAAEFAPESPLEYTAESVSQSITEAVTESVTESGDETLPWIDAFTLDPLESHAAADEVSALDAAAVDASAVEAATDEAAAVEASGAAPSNEVPDDSWVMNEASADIAQLADELSAISAEASPSGTAAGAEPHLPWQEDEAWMDIMPALPNSGGRDIAAETEWARAFGEPPAPLLPPPLPTGDAQAAAASLESIARRLRAGELNVPGFHAARGDAAALAAALAALLGANDS